MSRPLKIINNIILLSEKVAKFIKILVHFIHGGDTSTCCLLIRNFLDLHKNTKENDSPKFQWQSSFFDHVVRNEHDFEYYMDYTIFNYEKHGVEEDYKYSSLNYEDLVDEY